MTVTYLLDPPFICAIRVVLIHISITDPAVNINVLVAYPTSSILTLGLTSSCDLRVGVSREECVEWFMATI
jgi:hypothetical protein